MSPARPPEGTCSAARQGEGTPVNAVGGDPAVRAQREAFYERIDRQHMAPLWAVMANLVPATPTTPCEVAHWGYAGVREHLLEAGRLITAKEAERRVLVLENPGLRGASSITHSLYAGYQLILPGEVAPSHRHAATAVRLVVEGEGAYTAVDGERAPMAPGDFIITPSWTFHDHGNSGDQPVVWLDGLDVPMVQFFDAGFCERHAQDTQPLTGAADDALLRYGANLLPVDYVANPHISPVFRYPYERTRSTLLGLAHNGTVDARHGVKLRYSHPGTGGWPTPTIGAFAQWLPDGFEGAPYRSTDGTVYCVVEGRGSSQIGEHTVHWQPHDVFVVPSWVPVAHRAESGAVLFSLSDRPAQQAMGFWREA